LLPDKHNPSTIVEVALVNRVTVVKVHQLDNKQEMLSRGLLTSMATVSRRRLEQEELYVLRRSVYWLKMKPQ
jgi:hypothetical protein